MNSEQKETKKQTEVLSEEALAKATGGARRPSNIRKQKCALCNAEFADFGAYKEHMEMVHPGK